MYVYGYLGQRAYLGPNMPLLPGAFERLPSQRPKLPTAVPPPFQYNSEGAGNLLVPALEWKTSWRFRVVCARAYSFLRSPPPLEADVYKTEFYGTPAEADKLIKKIYSLYGNCGSGWTSYVYFSMKRLISKDEWCGAYIWPHKPWTITGEVNPAYAKAILATPTSAAIKASKGFCP